MHHKLKSFIRARKWTFVSVGLQNKLKTAVNSPTLAKKYSKKAFYIVLSQGHMSHGENVTLILKIGAFLWLY